MNLRLGLARCEEGGRVFGEDVALLVLIYEEPQDVGGRVLLRKADQLGEGLVEEVVS